MGRNSEKQESAPRRERIKFVSGDIGDKKGYYWFEAEYDVYPDGRAMLVPGTLKKCGPAPEPAPEKETKAGKKRRNKNPP